MRSSLFCWWMLAYYQLRTEQTFIHLQTRASFYDEGKKALNEELLTVAIN